LADFRLATQSEIPILQEESLHAILTSNFKRQLRTTCDCGLADGCTVNYEY
jgi:hypothetical protein